MGKRHQHPCPPLDSVSSSDSTPRFLALLDEHRRILYKVARAYTRSDTDREDLVQEIIAQLWRAFPGWDPARRFSTWMYRIALNTGISWRRGESRRERRVAPGDPALLDVAAPEPHEPDERLTRLYGFIAELPEADRALVLLHLDGHRHDVIAEIMGISESNVATRMHRIKQRLRAKV